MAPAVFYAYFSTRDLMFSRRHPYLYFLIIFSGIAAAAAVVLAGLAVLGLRGCSCPGIGKMGGEKVGVVEINGVIADATVVMGQIKNFREDDSIKAIVLRINSPGGGVGPSQEIFREVQKTVKVKKIVVSMGAVAASGGYYVAAGADGIMANPGTITGSIGVIMQFTNFQELLGRIGLTPVVVKSGEFKDTGSPSRQMTDAEKKLLQDVVDTIQRQFVRAIVKGRGMAADKVESIADGRIFSGEKALEIGLVDRLGNFEDAIEWAGRMGGIKGKVTAVHAKRKRLSLIRYITGSSSIRSLIESATRPEMYTGYLYRPAGD
ncbi:MAG: signal peptide peptidase SppA [Deltaproteobacteria bacterium]|nr:MAG: signal peptide peptidase SppA [Deltaproteobacteria bacterium]